jgi:hypothetical protein
MPNPALNVYSGYQTAKTSHLKITINSVLLSPSAQKIDFWLGSIHVDGPGFRTVVDALNHYKVFVKVGGVPRGAAAAYDTMNNCFNLPTATYGQSAVDKQAVVHEAVHAIQDIAGGTLYSTRGSIFTSESENESAAYIAQELYGCYESIPAPGSSIGGRPTRYLPQPVKARLIAESIKDNKNAL